MQANPKPPRLPGHEATERAILALLLASDPMSLTIPEMAREFGDRDLVMRAACSLADFGLLEFRGGKAESLRPTDAARRCHKLDAW
jgi:hypothetical protein